MAVTTPTSLLGRLLDHVGNRNLNGKPKIIKPDILSLLSYGRLKQALGVLFSINKPVDQSIYAHFLQLCTDRKAINEGRKVEIHLLKFQMNPSVFLLNRIIEMYAKCGSMTDALQVFDRMRKPNGGSWNAMISGFEYLGFHENVLDYFWSMYGLGIRPNQVTFACVLSACASLMALGPARQVHCLILKWGFFSNVVLSSSIVDVYGKCRAIEESKRVFGEIKNPNNISWNVIIKRCCEVGREEEALVLFFQMHRAKAKPMNFTFANVLSACASTLGIEEGCQIHALSIRHGLDVDDYITSSLVDMYSKCGFLEEARRVFDNAHTRNVITWTAILSGYSKHGFTEEARNFFDEMPQRNVVSWNAMLVGYTQLCRWEEGLDFFSKMRREACEIDHVTLGLVLNICAGLTDLELGKQVHAFVNRHGFSSYLFTCNSLLDMYGKCGSLRSMDRWFFAMAQKDIVSWNSFMSSYARHGQSEETLRIFGEMDRDVKLNEFTISTVLAACSNILSLQHGKQLHGYTIRTFLERDIVIRGALVDMYSKCRCLDYALKVFYEVCLADIVLWNSMISGCAHNKRGKEALELFELMQQSGVKPDNVTFVGILVACISEGMVDIGRWFFNSMSEKHCVIPRVEHYALMVELFGRNGCMDELKDFIGALPFEPTPAMWMLVSECCRNHGDTRLGELASQRLHELDEIGLKPINSAPCETDLGLRNSLN
ncbi:hypothetical protein AMTRI_Chr01g104760 [Amborella trichopoda]